jgi:hypothetical protein
MLRHRFSDQDVERLFCGEIPNNQALATLSPILSSLQSVSWAPPSEERVVRFATKAAEVAQAAEPVPTINSARLQARSGWRLSLSRGLATGVASLLVFSGMTAIAIASNGAAPGDALYGIDRALEAVGIGDGAAAERIAEARVLFDRGAVTEAIDHASEAVTDTGGDGIADFSPEASNAAAALQTAADKVQANDQAQSQQVRNAVAAMLAEMAAMLQDPAIEGKDFGQKVAEMAGTIGGKDNAGPPENTPGAPENDPGPPEDKPEPPESPPGKPEGTPAKPDTTPGQSSGGSSGQSGPP